MAVLAACGSAGSSALASEDAPRAAARLYREGKAAEARALLESRIAEAPDDIDAHLAYVDLRVALGEKERARGEYREKALRDPSNAAVRLAHALLFGDTRIKVGMIQKLLADRPDLARGWEEYGRYLLRTYGVGEARDAFLRAVELEPDRAESRLFLGLAYRAEARRAEEEAEIRKAYALDPSVPGARLELATTLAFKGDLAEAEGLLEPLVRETPTDPEALTLLALVKERLGRGGDAAGLRKRALQSSPGFAEKMLYLGIQSEALKAKELARRFIEISIFLDSTNAEAWGQLGLVHRWEGNLDPAIACYTKAVSVEEGDQLAWRSLGACYRDKGDLEKAEYFFGKSVEADPDYVAGWIDFARIRQTRGNAPGAIEIWNRVLRMAPYGWEAHEARRAISYLERGEPVPELKPDLRTPALADSLKQKSGVSAP
jgi:tetratricopeptide (TPR) repeat protein